MNHSEASVPLHTIKFSPCLSGTSGYSIKGGTLPNGFWHRTAEEAVIYCRSVLKYGRLALAADYDKEGTHSKTATS